jgi:hypothetical protein
MIPQLKILVASPGDVKDERQQAHEVIRRVQDDAAFAGQIEIVPVFWELQPQHAGETFQKQINHPADADLVACIFWSKLGSPLPDRPEYRGADGKPRTGTEYEFEEGLRGWQRRGSPQVWVYRSKRPVSFHPGPGGADAEEKRQYDKLNAFWERAIARPSRAHKWFADADEFARVFAGDLRVAVKERIASAGAIGSVVAKLNEHARAWKEQTYPARLLLRSGQLLQQAADIQRTYRSQLDPETNAYISDSLQARSRRTALVYGSGLALALVLLAATLASLAGAIYFYMDAERARSNERNALKSVISALAILDEVTNGDAFFALQDQFRKDGPKRQNEIYEAVLGLLKTDELHCIDDLATRGDKQVQEEKGAWMIISVLNNLRAHEVMDRLDKSRPKEGGTFDYANNARDIAAAKEALQRQLDVDQILLAKTKHPILFTHIAYDLMVYEEFYLVIMDQQQKQRYRDELERHIDDSLAKHPGDAEMHRNMVEINRRRAKFSDQYGDAEGWEIATRNQYAIRSTFLDRHPDEKAEQELSQAYVRDPWQALLRGRFQFAKHLTRAGMDRYKTRVASPFFNNQFYLIHTTYADSLLLLHEFDAARKIYAANKADPRFRDYARRDLGNLRKSESPALRKALANPELQIQITEIEQLLSDVK